MPDIIIIDIDLNGISGIEVIEKLRDAQYRLPIIVMSGKNADYYAKRSARCGANGFISKKNNLHTLLTAIETVSAGYGYFPLKMNNAEEMAQQIDDRQRLETLSVREFQVLQYIAQGMEVASIAIRMKISNKTVSTYKSRMMDKLDLRTRTEINEFVRRHQIS